MKRRHYLNPVIWNKLFDPGSLPLKRTEIINDRQCRLEPLVKLRFILHIQDRENVDLRLTLQIQPILIGSYPNFTSPYECNIRDFFEPKVIILIIFFLLAREALNLINKSYPSYAYLILWDGEILRPSMYAQCSNQSTRLIDIYIDTLYLLLV